MSELLVGAELDAAVARALGWEHFTNHYGDGDNAHSVVWAKKPKDWPTHACNRFEPSTDWTDGGHIIELMHISLEPGFVGLDATPMWGATLWPDGASDDTFAAGPTPLIAAMRALVASKESEHGIKGSE